MTTATQQLPANPALEFAQSILDVTNNALDLIEILNEIAEDEEKAGTNDRITAANSLLDIAKADDDPRITPYHRRRATIILIDRALGTDPTPVLRTVQERPELGQSVPHNPEYPPGYIFDPTKELHLLQLQSLDMPEGHEGDHRRDHEGYGQERVAEIQRMLEERGHTHPQTPIAPKDRHIPCTGRPEDWVPDPISRSSEKRPPISGLRSNLSIRAPKGTGPSHRRAPPPRSSPRSTPPTQTTTANNPIHRDASSS